MKPAWPIENWPAKPLTMLSDTASTIAMPPAVPSDSVVSDGWAFVHDDVAEQPGAGQGTVSPAAGGAVTYTPPAGFVSFDWKVDAAEAAVTVRDSGIGMDEVTVRRAMEPFFTTKPTGEGTGLGLSLSYDIITKGHGGEIKVNTIASEGTEFIIQLPAQSAEKPA